MCLKMKWRNKENLRMKQNHLLSRSMKSTVIYNKVSEDEKMTLSESVLHSTIMSSRDQGSSKNKLGASSSHSNGNRYDFQKSKEFYKNDQQSRDKGEYTFFHVFLSLSLKLPTQPSIITKQIIPKTQTWAEMQCVVLPRKITVETEQSHHRHRLE